MEENKDWNNQNSGGSRPSSETKLPREQERESELTVEELEEVQGGIKPVMSEPEPFPVNAQVKKSISLPLTGISYGI